MKPKPLTMQDLFKSALEIHGLFEHEARKVLKPFGKFDPKDWGKYQTALSAFKYEKLAKKMWPPCCPICKGKIVRDTSRTRKAQWSWDCVEDTTHYWKARGLSLTNSIQIGILRKYIKESE